MVVRRVELAGRVEHAKAIQLEQPALDLTSRWSFTNWRTCAAVLRKVKCIRFCDHVLSLHLRVRS
jgi:hypothetical protein